MQHGSRHRRRSGTGGRRPRHPASSPSYARADFRSPPSRTNAALAAQTIGAGRRFAGITIEPDGAELEHLALLVGDGHLRGHIEHTLPLQDAVKAHALLTTAPPGRNVLTT